MLALVLAPVVVLAPPPPAHCGLPVTTSAANHSTVQPRKLGDLPDAEMELAVLRTLDGCSVRQVVRFHVSDRSPTIGETQGLEVPGYTGRMVVEGPAGRHGAEPVR